ncbi:bacillithiol system protein YtxJ [Carboxydocella sporoproducens DSM 16521]|uniref:Bacillithiol system protein YtxJ n=2 Tax=Carboxydocella TaxID=178898 RepID=A0A1T4QQ32_9FIRM|nr:MULTISPECIES: bacillithiol system redox-active protein YtxJ [Carboxydocella]AVX21553.1 bacillithiol system protein YtxJ [Carboxydocella thermautotrophica]AVX32034.1 bacillithiol system protein YtxJ [Carboxydocella thermautotrophica]SKA05368.1 bacillithiol system protein YtxJ [Carboxydocella sporoproducens DSM 16521]
MGKFIDVMQVEELEEILRQGGKKLFFKHSATCPISARAHQEVEQWLAERGPEQVVYRIVVQAARPVSNRLAEVSGVAHASPQVLWLDGTSPLWHTSHGQITRANLQAHIN